VADIDLIMGYDGSIPIAIEVLKEMGRK